MSKEVSVTSIAKRDEAPKALTIELNDLLKQEWKAHQDTYATFEGWLADTLGSDTETTYTLELHETSEGEVCIKIPDELMLALGWKIDDDVMFEETDQDGGFIMQNTSKQFRDAHIALRNAVSVDME